MKIKTQDIKQYRKDYYQAHKEDYKRRRKKWQKENPEKCREYCRQYDLKRKKEKRKEDKILVEQWGKRLFEMGMRFGDPFYSERHMNAMWKIIRKAIKDPKIIEPKPKWYKRLLK